MEDRNIQGAGTAIYSTAARRFHWWTVALVAVQIPIGFYMAYRGNTLNIWDGVTNNLYSTHKLLGIVIFILVLARLMYRLAHGAPPDEPTIEPWQKAASHFTHWGLYVLLLVMPILGYVGVSLFPALDVFGISLPAVTAANQGAAATVLFWHMLGASLLIILIGAHFGGAMFHYFIRRDGVLGRMWVRAGRLGQ
jgi:cytochrome b561